MSDPQNIKVTVDIVVLSLQHKALHVLLIQRKNDPFKGHWAIPGGFVEDEEPLEKAASRELEEETGIKVGELYQFHTFGKPGRDPRGRMISVAYLTLIDHQAFDPKANTDAREVQWFPVDALPKLAFDHDVIIKKALTEIQWIHARATNQTQYTKQMPDSSNFTILKDYLSNRLNDPD